MKCSDINFSHSQKFQKFQKAPKTFFQLGLIVVTNVRGLVFKEFFMCSHIFAAKVPKNQSGRGVMGRPARFDSIHDSIGIFDSYTNPSCTRPTSNFS